MDSSDYSQFTWAEYKVPSFFRSSIAPRICVWFDYFNAVQPPSHPISLKIGPHYCPDISMASRLKEHLLISCSCFNSNHLDFFPPGKTCKQLPTHWRLSCSNQDMPSRWPWEQDVLARNVGSGQDLILSQPLRKVNAKAAPGDSEGGPAHGGTGRRKDSRLRKSLWRWRKIPIIYACMYTGRKQERLCLCLLKVDFIFTNWRCRICANESEGAAEGECWE